MSKYVKYDFIIDKESNLFAIITNVDAHKYYWNVYNSMDGGFIRSFGGTIAVVDDHPDLLKIKPTKLAVAYYSVPRGKNESI